MMMMMIMIAGFVDSIRTPIHAWLDKEENNALLERCKHGFHVECVEAWLKDHPNCPLCRTSISGDDQDTHRHKVYLKRAVLRLQKLLQFSVSWRPWQGEKQSGRRLRGVARHEEGMCPGVGEVMGLWRFLVWVVGCGWGGTANNEEKRRYSWLLLYLWGLRLAGLLHCAYTRQPLPETVAFNPVLISENTSWRQKFLVGRVTFMFTELLLGWLIGVGGHETRPGDPGGRLSWAYTVTTRYITTEWMGLEIRWDDDVRSLGGALQAELNQLKFEAIQHLHE
ncbi:zinc finger, RING/FYVE/PHD-type containing protein [Tanacetum coccineum]